MKKYLFFLLLIWSAQRLTAQQQVADSLLQVLPGIKHDTAKAWLLLRIGYALRDVNIKQASEYINEGYALSKKIAFKRGILKGSVERAGLFQAEGNVDSVFACNKTTLLHAKEYNDTIYMGIAYANLAESYNDLNDKENALSTALKGLAIIENSNNDLLKEDTYNLLLRIYVGREEFSKALEYGNKALELSHKMNLPQRQALTLINIAEIYTETKDYSKALEYSLQFIAICKQIENERFESYGYSTLAKIYLLTNKVELAKSNAEKCMILSKKIGDKSNEATALKILSNCYLQTQNYTLAKEYAEAALAINQAQHDNENIFANKRTLANIAFATGDTKKGIQLEQECQQFQTTYIQGVLSKQSSELEKKYETQKKEALINLQQIQLQHKNIITYLLVGVIAALLLTLWLFFRNYKQRQHLQQKRISELETEKKLAATEAVLKGEEQERGRLAKDLHDGLGGMLSGIKFSLNDIKENQILTPNNAHAFEHSMHLLDNSIKEMRRVAQNLMPESLLKFGLNDALSDYCNEMNAKGMLRVVYQSFGLKEVTVEQALSVSIYRITQELLNNIVKHAEASKAIVQISIANNQIQLTVEDDGKGINHQQLETASGVGWKSIQSRVAYHKGTITLQTDAGKGTSVVIDFLLEQDNHHL